METVKETLKKIGATAIDMKNQIKRVATVKLSPVFSSSDDRVVTLVSSKTFASQVTKANVIYVVKYEFDLNNKTVQLPDNCTLEFKGGKLMNGTLIGNNSIIHADRKIFDNVSVDGVWSCIGNAIWWTEGSIINKWNTPNNVDDYSGIQLALDSSFREIVFPPRIYYTSKTLVLNKEKRLVLQGTAMANSLAMCLDTRLNTAAIYTDKDIDLLLINVTENGSYPCTVSIEGGNFDVSLIRNEDNTGFTHYTHSCIKVVADDYNARIWGLTINTNIFGTGSKSNGIGIDLNPTQANPVPNKEYNLADYGYMTQINIGGTIHDMCVGIKAASYSYNWCSGLRIDCGELFCKKAVIINNVDTDVRGLIQADHIETSDNANALIDIDSAYFTAICASIFDINNKKDTARYAVNIVSNGGSVQAYGSFAALCNGVSDSLCTGFTNRFHK